MIYELKSYVWHLTLHIIWRLNFHWIEKLFILFCNQAVKVFFVIVRSRLVLKSTKISLKISKSEVLDPFKRCLLTLTHHYFGNIIWIMLNVSGELLLILIKFKFYAYSNKTLLNFSGKHFWNSHFLTVIFLP